MRFSTIAFTLFGAAASASASSLLARQSLPACADSCVAEANLGGCVATDTLCLCTSQAFVSSTTSCIESACTGSDLQSALSYAQGLCLAVGVTLTSTPASTATAPASTATTATTSATTSASAAGTSSTAKNSASSHGVSTLFGLVSVGLVAFAL